MNYIDDLTSQQYYRGLNKRFDRRAKLLSKLGYKYKRLNDQLVDGYNTAVFVRERNIHTGKTRRTIPVSVLFFAPNRGFFAYLS